MPSDDGFAGIGSTFRLRTDGVVWRELDGEIIVLEVESGLYLNLNGSAKLLWSVLVDDADSAALARALVEAYGIPEERALTDAQTFLSDLASRSLVEPVR